MMVGGPRNYYAFELFLEIRGENEVFKPYNRGGEGGGGGGGGSRKRGERVGNKGDREREKEGGRRESSWYYNYISIYLGLNLKVLLADISSNEVTVPVAVRAEQSWTVLEMKEAIAEVGSEPFMNCSEGRGEGGRGRRREG